VIPEGPPHAITVRYGDGGLRERLIVEAGRLPAAGRERALAALEWMTRLHAGDHRQREPYPCHPQLQRRRLRGPT
jgi:hypothetical protein